MKVLLTGGSGDLGSIVAKQLAERGDVPVKLDLRKPADMESQFIEGSILDRQVLESALAGVDCVVHIAAWHGIHEFKKEKDAYDFWNLNVTGTFMLLEACARMQVPKFVFISSTSVDDWPGIYAHSKLLAEDLVRTYMARHNMRAITLRPRAFIPHWNRTVYANFDEWAQWYWKGAVHVNDVSQAVVRAIDALQTAADKHAILTIDGACEFSQEELENWDAEGEGSIFRKHFSEESYQLFLRHGLNPARKPKVLGAAEAEKLIGYKPNYGFAQLLKDLALHEQESNSKGTDS
jgi:nucleoside-diphosphate-sugar epimerase